MADQSRYDVIGKVYLKSVAIVGTVAALSQVTEEVPRGQETLLTELTWRAWSQIVVLRRLS